MKVLKFCALSAILILLNGCGNYLTGAQFDAAKSEIASNIYGEYLNKKYTAFTKTVMIDQVSGESIAIEPLPYSIDFTILEKCASKLAISKDDIEEVVKGLTTRGYVLTPTANIDKTAFNNCVAHELNTIKLDAQNLELLINNSDFQKMKKQPEFDRKIKEIKQDGVISLHEALEILSIMRNHEKNIAKVDYQSKIKAL